jgi:hypothetical protein
MAVFSKRDFSEGVVDLDGNEFHGCRFANVTFNYGGGIVGFTDCHFGQVAWNFEGALGNGLQMLAQLYGAFGRTEALVEMLAGLVRAKAGTPPVGGSAAER